MARGTAEAARVPHPRQAHEGSNLAVRSVAALDTSWIVIRRIEGVRRWRAFTDYRRATAGGRAVTVVRQNYAMSIAVDAIGFLVGAGGALSPVLAAILHNASSVAVVANSSRLIRYQLVDKPSRRKD